MPSHVLLLALILAPADEPDRAAYRVLGHDRGKVAILDARGNVEWQFESKAEGHDIALLPGGNVLVHLGPATVGEVSRDKKVVWKYESKPTAATENPGAAAPAVAGAAARAAAARTSARRTVYGPVESVVVIVLVYVPGGTDGGTVSVSAPVSGVKVQAPAPPSGR